jgi:MFS family permease
MPNPEVKFEPWLRQAFDLYANNFVLLLLTHLVLIAVSTFTLGILAGPLAAGTAMIVLRLLDDTTPKPEPGDIFKGFEFFLPSLLLSVCVGAAAFVVFRVLRLLGLGILAWAGPIPVLTGTLFSLYLIVEHRLDFAASIRTSLQAVKPVFGPLCGLVAIGYVAGMAGALGFVVGIAVTAPFFTCLTAIVWRSLGDRDAADDGGGNTSAHGE